MTTSTPTRKRASRSAAVQAVPNEPADEATDELSDAVEFTVTFDRDGDAEEHTFAARPKFSYKRMREAATAQAKGGAAALLRFEKMIRPSLCDDDGVPSKWVPEVNAGKFVDPDGVERDVADLSALLAPEAGSSRRRWAHLMDDDDEVEIEIDDIVKAYEVLVGAATERPTQKSRS